MFDSERNADYCNTEDKSAYKMDESYFPPSGKNPYQVHYDRNTARFVLSVNHFPAERPEGEAAKFEKLDSERYSNDCQAHKKACDKIEKAVMIPPIRSHKIFPTKFISSYGCSDYKYSE